MNCGDQQNSAMRVKIPLNCSASFTVQMSSDGKTGFKVDDWARADMLRQKKRERWYDQMDGHEWEIEIEGSYQKK